MPRIRRKLKPPPELKRNSQFKEYLRRDFDFRCAYCHQPEDPLPVSAFGVEHFRPKAKFPALQFRYSNLLYACNDCNRIKGETWPDRHGRAAGQRFLNPCQDAFEEHLIISPQGRVTPLTSAGDYFLRHLQLNREALVAWRERKHILAGWIQELTPLYAGLQARDEQRAQALFANLRFLQAEFDKYGDFWTYAAATA